ncbi:Rho termination factor N-terminal domain-containing protein [Mumia qirimensis]|uniref:Rho termination factor N-terminal domain-containing protein n=1 Tax=Mumia qirimensis TaxID=3234852 RepID=UPI00351D17C0
MAKKTKSSKVEIELRKRVAELEKALDDVTSRLKRARKDADKSRVDAEKAIRKASKSAQRKIAETVDAARDELRRVRPGAATGSAGGDSEPSVSAPPSAATAGATPNPTLKKVAARDVPKPKPAKKTTTKKTTAKKATAKKSTARKTAPSAKKASASTSSAAPGGSYASMTVVELRKAARTKGVKGYSSMSKADLVSRLEG